MKSLEKEIRITGLSINTTNENNQGMQDIGKLWQEFTKHPVFSKYVAEGCSIYTVYDQYETDETGKYRFTVGIKDLNLSEDFATATIQKGSYHGFKVSPATSENIGKSWYAIWQDKSLNRSFATDFEIYEKEKMTIYIG